MSADTASADEVRAGAAGRRTARRAAGLISIQQSGEPRESVASGDGVCWLRFRAAPSVLRRRSCPPSGMAGLRCASSSHEPFPKTALRAFGVMRGNVCMADPSRPRDPGKGEASHAGGASRPGTPRLFRPCRTFRQSTKAPPPARIDTLRDPSGGGRRFRIARVLGAGKIGGG